MNSIEILEKLQAKNKNFRLPSGMKFSVEDKVLTIKMEEKGLTSNMQTDDSAFEGWAICLKTLLPEYIDMVKISGDILLSTARNKKEHYNRFIYRLKKFTEIYPWAYTDNYNEEIKNFGKHQLVINVPIPDKNTDTEKKIFHKEAKIEKAYCDKYKSIYEAIDHQLPVHLFDKLVSKKENYSITPSSFLDIWSIYKNTLNIYELKTSTNKKVGIISELFFYVNVMVDLMSKNILIPKDSTHRSFENIYSMYKEGKCKNINGIFLTDKLHPMIESEKETLIKTINDGQWSSKIKVEFKHQKVLEYNCLQTSRQIKLLSEPIMEKAEANGPMIIKSNNKKYTIYPDYMLKPICSSVNLYSGIRDFAIEYFKDHDITWWGESGSMPSGHLVSSQIHCLNHLFALRKDDAAIKAIIEKATGLQIKQVIPSPLDKDGGYITFEFICKNKTLLGEEHETRGAKCTSVDAFVLVETEKEKKILIPIEWKYTESYEKTPKKRARKKSIERYVDLANLTSSNLKEWILDYEWDPLYEFARQELLMEQIIAKHPVCGFGYKKKPLEADDFIHIIVRPNDNAEIKKDIATFRETIVDKSKLIEVDPKEFLAPIDEKNLYPELITYLETRYWK